MNIYEACRQGYFYKVKDMLDLGEIDINKGDASENTLLHIAAKNGHFFIVEYLIRAGAIVDKVNNHGNTPLHAAIDNNRLHTVKELVKCGANMEHRGNRYPFINITPLFRAIDNSYVKIVRFLLENGADVNSKIDWNDNSINYIYVAIDRGDPDIIFTLLDYGTEIDHKLLEYSLEYNYPMKEYYRRCQIIKEWTFILPKKWMFSNWVVFIVLKIISDWDGIRLPGEIIVCEIGRWLFF